MTGGSGRLVVAEAAVTTAEAAVAAAQARNSGEPAAATTARPVLTAAARPDSRLRVGRR